MNKALTYRWLLSNETRIVSAKSAEILKHNIDYQNMVNICEQLENYYRNILPTITKVVAVPAYLSVMCEHLTIDYDRDTYRAEWFLENNIPKYKEFKDDIYRISRRANEIAESYYERIKASFVLNGADETFRTELLTLLGIDIDIK